MHYYTIAFKPPLYLSIFPFASIYLSIQLSMLLTYLFSSLGFGTGLPRVAEALGPALPYTRMSKLWVAEMLEHLG